MNQFEQNLGRFKQPAMVLAGGIGAALAVASIPHGYLEQVIGLTGIADFVPAAAPPLGNTARGLVATAAGLVAASALYLILNRKGDPDMGVALREQINAKSRAEAEENAAVIPEKKGFSLAALTGFLKKRKKAKTENDQVTELSDLPKLRGEDTHPDAPPRRPIFADADLGTPLPSEEPSQDLSEEISEEPAEGLSSIEAFDEPPVEPYDQAELTPDAPAKVGQKLADDFHHAEAPDAVDLPVDQSLSAPEQPAELPEPAEDLSNLSIAQLTDRLEFGLRRLKQLEAASERVSTIANQITDYADTSPADTSGRSEQAAPETAQPTLKSVEQPAEEMSGEHEADMDAALKAALGTLQRMHHN